MVAMYLRHTTRRKDGKTHVYWQLVRSVRLGRKVVQETVAQLGELDAQGRARARGLARSSSGQAQDSAQGSLFEAGQLGEAVKVRLDAVRLERARSFGAVWLGCKLWQALKLDELVEQLRPAPRRQVHAPDRACALGICHRIFQPDRLLHLRVAARRHRLGTGVEGVDAPGQLEVLGAGTQGVIGLRRDQLGQLEDGLGLR
jgi:hypothetical protein